MAEKLIFEQNTLHVLKFMIVFLLFWKMFVSIRFCVFVWNGRLTHNVRKIESVSFTTVAENFDSVSLFLSGSLNYVTSYLKVFNLIFSFFFKIYHHLLSTLIAVREFQFVSDLNLEFQEMFFCGFKHSSCKFC